MLDLGLGWTEILVIAVLAIVVVGPKDLPRLFRSVGGFVTKMRRMAGEFQKQFTDAMNEADLGDVQKEVQSLTRLDPLKDIKKELEPATRIGADINRQLAKPLAGSAATAAPAAQPADATAAVAALAASAPAAVAHAAAAPAHAAAAPADAVTEPVAADSAPAESAPAGPVEDNRSPWERMTEEERAAIAYHSADAYDAQVVSLSAKRVFDPPPEPQAPAPVESAAADAAPEAASGETPDEEEAMPAQPLAAGGRRGA